MANAKAKKVSETNRRFPDELTKDFFEALRKVQSDSQKGIENANRTLTSVPVELQSKARTQVLEALNTYADAMRAAVGQSNSTHRIEEAILKYTEALQRTGETTQKELTEAVQEYIDALRELPESVRKNVNAAYSEYCSELGDILGTIDWEKVEPNAMAALAKSMLAVSLYTSAVLGK